MQASVSLADEILNATKSLRAMNMEGNSLPTNPAVASYETTYWESMANGTGLDTLMGTYNGLGVSDGSAIFLDSCKLLLIWSLTCRESFWTSR